ncbi:oxidoreductase [Rhodopirellula sp. SM50]|nr:Gfo/Idh/MocA family oxidoreductase [Rhodopirellula sp. SM50]PAY17928.1 oxidoreductase [Rhodopirellula sp. SM50]
MKPNRLNRRRALASSLSFAGAAVLAGRDQRALGFAAANERPRVGAVGTGSRWCIKATGIDRPYGSAPDFRKYGDYVAICDADANRLAMASDLVKNWTGTKPTASADYRSILDDDRIDIVHISTPEHWHAKVAIEAMLAGKDVYCEKPMTLTIEEGRLMSDVCKKTGRVVQIGTQQRSSRQFIQAIALIRAGRLGELKKATCSIGGAPTSPTLPAVAPPKHFDWNLWQGPVAKSEFHYLAGDYGETKSWSRGHYEFRWWYEYSGGKLTDWGAHHVDIATWGLGLTETGPISVEPVHVKHPVEFKDGYPVDHTRYNTATEFLMTATFADGKEIEIRHDGDNGILFEGTEGRLFVNRGRITGKPVEDLKTNPLPAQALEEAYKNRPLTDHFRNFFEAARDKTEPISDVFSHHRALSTCHLAGIAARLDRTIHWDPKQEQVVGDPLAQSLVARDRRKGFEIEM